MSHPSITALELPEGPDDFDPPHVRALYRERAHLIAALATVCPAVICANDPSADRPVIYVQTTSGQLSWHLDAADLRLFGHVRVAAPDAADAPVWDQHSSADKYERLAAWTAAQPRPDEQQTPLAGNWSGLLLNFRQPTAEGHLLNEPTTTVSDPQQANAELVDENGTVIGTVDRAWCTEGALYGVGRVFGTPAGLAAATRCGGPVGIELSATDTHMAADVEEPVIVHYLHEPWHLKAVRLRQDEAQPEARITIVPSIPGR